VLAGATFQLAFAQDKLPIPPAEAQAKALTLIKEVYGQEWEAAKTSAQRQVLAAKLLQKATESTDDDASHYMLLHVAQNLASQAADAELAFKAIEAMAAKYDVDTYRLKGSALSGAAKSATTEQSVTVAKLALALTDEAVERDDFVGARFLGGLALDSARKGRDVALVKQIVERNREMEEVAQAFVAIEDAQATLKSNPVEPDANLAVGRYHCLVKGNWERGLPMLALGSDSTLKELAVKELKGVSETDRQVALGDAWWDLAATSEGVAQKQLEGRAGLWYRKAMPGLSGLVKDRVEKRVIGETPALTEDTDRFVTSLTNSIGMKFVLIPAGEFMMGSTDVELDKVVGEMRQQRQWSEYVAKSIPAEVPKHRIVITEPFYLGITEVTQGQYTRIMHHNPSSFCLTGNGSRMVQGLDTRTLPVESVPWHSANDFCRLLSALPEEMQPNRKYRLPTEAEWEHACRAGQTTAYCYGDDQIRLQQYAWFAATTMKVRTYPVGLKRPNAWGLYDMHGNVYEWCADWFAADWYGRSPAVDPAGPSSGDWRVVRGGSWENPAAVCRSSFRATEVPGKNNRRVGFRVVCTIE
jgi:formylglycine-generating enzyme required for sulfatase activity